MKMSRYLLLALVATGSTHAWGLDYTLELTREQLQQAVQAKMPVKVEKMFATLVLSNPVVVLQENSDRLGMETDLLFTVAGSNPTKGHGTIDGNIVFDKVKGEFHLVNPKVQSLKVAGMAPQVQETLRQLADTAAQQALASKPVYTLDDKDLKQKLAKAVLKSVAVINGKLALYMQF